MWAFLLKLCQVQRAQITLMCHFGVSKFSLPPEISPWLPSAGVSRIGSSDVKSNMASLASVTAARYCLLVTNHIDTMTVSKGCCVYV